MINAMHRLEAEISDVCRRDDLYHCVTCGEWQPLELFPHYECGAERFKVCKICELGETHEANRQTTPDC